MASNQLMEAPFDPGARYVDKETGVEYEDFAAWIEGRPKSSTRNLCLKGLAESKVPKQIRNRWWRSYDVAHFVCTEEDWDEGEDHLPRFNYAGQASGLDKHEERVKQADVQREFEKLRLQQQLAADKYQHELDAIKYGVLTQGLPAKPLRPYTPGRIAGVSIGDPLGSVGGLTHRVVTNPDGTKRVVKF